MKDEINFNQAEVNDYHERADKRSQTIALLTKLKAREAEGMAVSKVYWKNQQPTLIESSSRLYWESKLRPYGKPESKGLPATDSNPRVEATWERRMERKNRQSYTLEETQTMNFKTSGHLPAHYYMDESALEAYVESLTKEK